MSSMSPNHEGRFKFKGAGSFGFFFLIQLTGPDAKLVRFSPEGGAFAPLGSQGHPKHTVTLACHGGAPLEMG